MAHEECSEDLFCGACIKDEKESLIQQRDEACNLLIQAKKRLPQDTDGLKLWCLIEGFLEKIVVGK